MQYRHTLIVSPEGAESTRDAQGNWIPQTPTEEATEYPCRAEPVTNQQGFTNEQDGTRLDLAWTVYTKAKPGLIFGQEITVMDDEKVLLKDRVKRYSEGEFNTRIWL